MNAFFKTTPSILISSTLLFGALSAQAQIGFPQSGPSKDTSCTQPFRQFSITTAHTLGSLVCHLLANNLTEKTARSASNSFNFTHELSVTPTAEAFEIDGICAKSIRYNSPIDHKPVIAHAGYRLTLKIPKFEATCNPVIKGKLVAQSLDEKENNQPQSTGAKVLKALGLNSFGKGERSVKLEFIDKGFKDSASTQGTIYQREGQDYIGERSLQGISIGLDLGSIFRGHFSSATLSQGFSSDDKNVIGFGEAIGMSNAQFFYPKSESMLIPQFDLVKAAFQLSRSLEPSIANRDYIKLSGKSRELYIRQNGITQITPEFYRERADNDIVNRPDINENESDLMSYDYEGGTSAFYVAKHDLETNITYVQGCTDYSYSGDNNRVGKMKVSDCRQNIRNAQKNETLDFFK